MQDTEKLKDYFNEQIKIIKNNVIIKCGFELLKVWESDYNNDNDKVFNDVVKFIKERYEYFGKQF